MPLVKCKCGKVDILRTQITIPFQLFADFWLIILVLSSWALRNYKKLLGIFLSFVAIRKCKKFWDIWRIEFSGCFPNANSCYLRKRSLYVTLATASLDRFLIPKLARKSSQYVTHQMSLSTNCYISMQWAFLYLWKFVELLKCCWYGKELNLVWCRQPELRFVYITLFDVVKNTNLELCNKILCITPNFIRQVYKYQ